MNDPKRLEETLILLKESYTCTNTSNLKEISKLLNTLSEDLNLHLDVLFQGLSIASFKDEQISPELHQSLAVNLKNIIEKKAFKLNNEQLSYLVKKIFSLYFPKIANPNLSKDSLINIFKHTLKTLLSALSEQDSSENDKSIDCENLFLILIDAIKKDNQNMDDYIISAKIVIKFTQCIFDSKLLNKNNYIKVINEYYSVILDNIFKHVPQYINPEKNLFIAEYFDILNYLIEDLYINLKAVSTIDDIDNVKYSEIFLNLFTKYGKLILELIKLQIPLGEKSKNILVNQNPIISFTFLENEKLCSNVNTMKSYCFQYLSYAVEKLSTKEKIDNLISFTLKDQFSIELFAELTRLIISSLEDILCNKEKFLIIKSSKEGILTSDKNYNNLLYHIFLFLSRCLIRNPIIKEFSSYIKYFVLNILFPFATFEESEKQFMQEDPETYIDYLQDILYDFKLRNFRTSLCFFIKKICDYYDECNLILNYIIEMIMFIFDNDNSNNYTQNNQMKYSVYLNGQNKSILNNFNDEIKIDLCFLIILLLQSKIAEFPNLLNKFILFFLSNQEKLHQINSNIILIKICEIYKSYIPHIFNNEKLKSFQVEEIKLRANISFVENMINFLLNIIINSSPQNNENSKEALISAASDAISSIFKFIKDNYSKKDQISENEINISRLDVIFHEKIRNSFKLLIGLINTYSKNTLFITIISKIISDVTINERQDIYTCLKLYTNIFMETINDLQEAQNSSLLTNHYFGLIKKFLTGKNKINQNEINLFNVIISPVIQCISEPNKYFFYDEIIELGLNYMKNINSINDISLKIINNIYPIIKGEKTITGYYYSFLSTFLSYINMYNITTYSSAINIILELIKLAYSFKDNKEYNNEDNLLHTLLLTMQILSFENSGINNDDIKYLITENITYCVEYFQLSENNVQESEESFEDTSLNGKIKQTLLANFSIFLLYYSEIFLKVIENDFNEIFKGTCCIKNIYDFIFNIYYQIFDIREKYYPSLGKCDILCICCSLSNQNICAHIMNDNNQKKNMFQLLIKLVVYHQKERKKINVKLTEEEIQCDFIECEENEEISKNIENEPDKYFENAVKISLKNYENVNKCDEFKIFNDTFHSIKNIDENLMNEIMNDFDKNETSIVYNLLHVRNIKVEYNGEKFEIPRRTLKIKRNFN